MFSRSVHKFVEAFETHFGAKKTGGGGGEGPGVLIEEKFTKGFEKLGGGFLRFQQVWRATRGASFRG